MYKDNYEGKYKPYSRADFGWVQVLFALKPSFCRIRKVPLCIKIQSGCQPSSQNNKQYKSANGDLQPAEDLSLT